MVLLLLLGGQGVGARTGGQNIVNARLAEVAARAVGSIGFLMAVTIGDNGAVGRVDGQENVVGMGPAKTEGLIGAGRDFGVVEAFEIKRQSATGNMEVAVIVGVITGGKIDRVFGKGLLGIVAQGLAGDINVE